MTETKMKHNFIMSLWTNKYIYKETLRCNLGGKKGNLLVTVRDTYIYNCPLIAEQMLTNLKVGR